MKVIAHLYDPATGQRGAYADPFDYGDVSATWRWLLGDWSCDCNRRTFLWELAGEDPAVDPDAFACGDDGILLERLVDAETGAVLWEPEA